MSVENVRCTSTVLFQDNALPLILFLTTRLSQDDYPPRIQYHNGVHSLAMTLLSREYHLEITQIVILSRISILLYEYYQEGGGIS